MKIFRPGIRARLKTYLIPKSSLLLLVFIAALIINSCKKDNKSAPPSNPQIAEARAWYESKYPTTGRPDKQTQGTGKDHDLSHWVKPDWQNTATYVRNTQSVIEMPVDPGSKFGLTMQLNKKRYNPAYSRSYFLLLNDGAKYEAYILTIIADSAYVNNDFSKLANNTYRKHDADFSGTVLYFTPKGDYVGGYGYKNGQLVAPGVSSVKTGSTQVQSVGTGKLTTNYMKQECTDWYIVYFVDGVYQSDEYLTTTCVTYDDGSGEGGSGAAPAPPPPPCPSGSHTGPPVERPCTKPAVASVNDRPTTINYVLPPPGDGGLPAPNKTACVVDPPAKPCPVVEDPCAAKAKISTKAANPIIAKQNASILASSTTLEYGADTRLSSLSGNIYKNTPIRTDGSTNSFQPSFTWNSTDGYTVGSSHLHPGGSAPSPDDIFTLIDNLSNPQLATSGASNIAFYKNNASITTVTKAGNYVVTINNWGTLNTLFQTFKKNPEAFDNNYQDIATNKLSTEYALLTIFGNAINVYKAPANSTTYSPITINAAGKVAKLNCN